MLRSKIYRGRVVVQLKRVPAIICARFQILGPISCPGQPSFSFLPGGEMEPDLSYSFMLRPQYPVEVQYVA